MTTSKNQLIMVARLGFRLSGKYMRPYSCAKSPHKFTQPQLMTCLILRAYLNTTYRGVIEFIDASPPLQETLGLQRLPHHTTLKHFANRSSVLAIVDVILAAVVKEFSLPGESGAIDSTGLKATAASTHFQTRSQCQRRRFIKLSVAVLCGSLLPAGAVFGWGPTNDKADAIELLMKSAPTIKPPLIYADAGYDAEWVHRFCNELWTTKSVIPPTVHRADGGVNGHYRSQMTPEYLKSQGYPMRWKVETYMSGLKRTMESMLQAQ